MVLSQAAGRRARGPRAGSTRGGRSYPKHGRRARPARRRERGSRRALPLVAATLLLGAGCITTPVTGRKALVPFPLSQDLALGAQAYEEVLQTEKPVTSGRDKEIVERVMRRLVEVADDRESYEWEVTLLDAPETVNAFALPGGKMAVYTGILPVCAGPDGDPENGLAVVMGHEIGHVVARHGMQRMTQQVGLELATSLFDAGKYQELVGPLMAVTVTLPFGRRDESEADHIGLVYMARAGYDPRGAVEFWSRMAAMSEGSPPEFLSTHPSNETRVRQLEELMPEALREYEKATGKRP